MNASESGERSTRVEREVLEILERSTADQSRLDNLQAAARRQRASARAKLTNNAPRQWIPRNWPEDIFRLGAALLLACGAAIIADHFRLGALVLAIASGIAFFSLWARPRTSSLGNAPRWRGQDLNDRDRLSNTDWGRILPWRGPKGPSR